MSHRRSRARLYAATLALSVAAPPLLAADYYFVGPSGSNFSDPANWSTSPTGPGGTPPTSSDTFGIDFVTPTSPSPFTLLLDASPNNVTLGNVLFSGANVTGGPLTVNTPASAGTIETRSISVGPNVAFDHSAGALRASGNTITFSGADTTYSLSGTGSLYASTIRFSDGVTATQSGGSVSAATNLTLGGGSHAVSYTLSGGTLSGDSTYLDGPAAVSLSQTGGSAGGFYDFTVGRNASYSLAAGTLATTDGPLYVGSNPHLTGTVPADAGSTLTQTGGTARLSISGSTDALVVNANAPGAPALYTLSGGNLLSPNHARIVIGDTSSGTFVQSGGTVGSASPFSDSSSPSALYLGRSAGATGTYSLSGTGALNTRSLHVGYSGSGTLAQSGGTLAVLNSAGPLFSLATNPGSSASYLLSGGAVSFSQTPSTFTVADAGTASVTQTGGTIGAPGVSGGNVVTPTYLYLAKSTGSAASYSLSGTDSHLYAGVEYVGNSGTATFSQSGGIHDVQGTLYLGYNAGATGTYNLSGGQLEAEDIHVAESGTATFNLSGGTASTSALSAAINGGASATLNLTGGTLTVSPPNPIGNVRLGYHGTATINHTEGTFDTSRNLVITTLGAGSTYSLSGTGSLEAYHLFVGDQGDTAASFTQSGGTNTVTASLALANNPGSSATYTLTGGSVSADSLSVGSGGGALFAQFGGAASFPSGIRVGGGPGTARYAVGPTGPNAPTGSSFPTLSAGPIVLDGPAAAMVIQNSGSVSASSILVGRNASYSYAGPGTLSTSGVILVGGTPPAPPPPTPPTPVPPSP